MANEEHLKILLSGIQAWDAWRVNNPCVVPDLRGADLQGRNLETVNLFGARLQGANLQEAWLKGANLSQAELHQAKLQGTRLQYAHLDGAYLFKADLSEAQLSKASLNRAKLIEVNLGDVSFLDANLNEAILSGASAQRVNFVSARLYRADLRGADLRGSRFIDTNLEEADLRETLLKDVDFRRADLRKTSFEKADLRKIDFRWANLRGSNLLAANLRGADFREANLADAILSEADLTDARLWRASVYDWFLKGVICERISWHENGDELTLYAPGEFERAYGAKTKIVVQFPGGMGPVEWALLPIKLEELQKQHPDSQINLRSIVDDGGSAKLTITVDDLAGRDREEFKSEVAQLQQELKEYKQALVLSRRTYTSLQADHAQLESLNVRLRDTLSEMAVDLYELRQRKTSNTYKTDNADPGQRDSRSEAMNLSESPHWGKAKDLLTQRLGNSWTRLADILCIPSESQRGFPQGEEAREIWKWLEDRNSLDNLPEALRSIDRSDLVEALVALHHQATNSSESQSSSKWNHDHHRPSIINLGGPIHMTGGDTYNVNGQAGAVGYGAQAQGNNFNQIWDQSKGSIDLGALAADLTKLREAIQGDITNGEQAMAIGAVAEAERAAQQGDGPKALEALKKGGNWVLDKAEKIGVPVATAAIRATLGL